MSAIPLSSRADPPRGDPMRGAIEYAALLAAMNTGQPACRDDERYVQDNPTPGDQIEMRETCSMCPLLAHCTAYRRAGRPTGGTWAGELMARGENQ